MEEFGSRMVLPDKPKGHLRCLLWLLVKLDSLAELVQKTGNVLCRSNWTDIPCWAFLNSCVLHCWIHSGTEADLKVVVFEIFRAASTEPVFFLGWNEHCWVLPFGKRHQAHPAGQSPPAIPRFIAVHSTSGSPRAVGKAGSCFPWPHPPSTPTLLLPPEEDGAAIRHCNHCKWPVQDNWKGIWAITGILISDSSRKELSSFLLVLLGLMFDRKWVWRVQEQVTELASLPAALPTLAVCLQKSETLACY